MSSTGTPLEPRDLVPRALLAEVAAYVGAPVAAASAGIIIARSSLGTGGRLLVAVVFAACCWPSGSGSATTSPRAGDSEA